MRNLVTGLLSSICLLLFCGTSTAREDTAYFEMAYRTEEPELLMRIYRPADWTEEDNRPAIVFFFGGGWSTGTPDQFDPHCKRLCELGFVAMAAEYRIRSKHQSTPFESFEDAKAAIRWVRENATTFGINPERIAAGGGSAGGHLAAATAVCLSNAVSDVRDTPDAVVAFNPALDLMMPAVKEMWGEEIYERIGEISPLQNLTAEHPPMIIFHGEADSTVLFDSAERYVEAAKAAGVDPVPELVGYPGKEHGFFNFKKDGGADYEDTVKRMIVFFRSLGWIAADPAP